MEVCDTGGIPAHLSLCVGKPYMLTANVEVMDGLVNGAIGLLGYIQHNTEETRWYSSGLTSHPKRLPE